MTKANFIPTNELESELVQLMSGQRPFDEFLKSLMEADLHLLSASEVRRDGSWLRPLLFDRDMGTLLAVFTSRDRGARFFEQASLQRKVTTGCPVDMRVIFKS